MPYLLEYIAGVTMAVDLKSVRKLESLPTSVTEGVRNDDDRFVVLVRLRDGAKQPDYFIPRAKMGPKIVTAEIRAKDLVRMDSDPDVVSVSLSRSLPLIQTK